MKPTIRRSNTYLIVTSVCLALLTCLSLRSASGQVAHAATPDASSPTFQVTPVGPTWQLTITFIAGPRQGQTELSTMTFRHNGGLTATFPGSGLPDTSDGYWYMTAPDAFHFSFRELIGQVVVQTQIDAYLSSAQAFEASGIGAVYTATFPEQPTGIYNVAHITAVAA